MFRTNYALGDFLLFSERVYSRMFELHNAALWPLHIVALAIGLFLLIVACRPRPALVRVAFGLLSVVWVFVAVSFLYWRYATINWAVVYLAPLFFLMAIVLAVFALRSKPPEMIKTRALPFWTALAVLVFALAGYPLSNVIAGQPWATAQMFGVVADPTAVATLAFLTLCRGKGIALAMAVPLLWILVTALTLFALDRSDYLMAPLAAMCCLVVFAVGERRRGTERATA